MNLEQAALYQRLQAFALDQPDAHLSFSRRLARDNNWSLEYANCVIEEYKKFAFLAVTAGHPVTPSDQVDQVWHLHLLYTRSYWEVFCPQVLQTPLHHGPTQGGKQEQHKFTDWYEQTLSSYERFFGLPPADIWSPSHIRFGHDIHFVRINTQSNWILPKFELPNLSSRLSLHRMLIPCFLSVFLGVAGCSEQTLQSLILLPNPFAESLSEFTITYLWMATIGLIGVIAVAGVAKLINRNTRLALVLLTLLSLLLFGLTLFRVGAEVAKPIGIAFLGFYLLAFFSGVLFTACGWFGQRSASTRTNRTANLQEPYPPSWEEFVASTAWTGTQATRFNELIGAISWLGMTSLCWLGMTRILIGLSRERPVGYLTVLCMILGFYTLIVVRRNSELESRISCLIRSLCKFLVTVSLVLTILGSIYFLWMQLGGIIKLLWMAFGVLLLVGILSNQTTYHSSGTRSSNNSHSSSSCGSDAGGDGGCGGGGCGGCGGCGG